jgi:hypothetical protein
VAVPGGAIKGSKTAIQGSRVTIRLLSVPLRTHDIATRLATDAAAREALQCATLLAVLLAHKIYS